MATIIQRGTRGIWTAVYYVPDASHPSGRRQVWKSTKLKQEGKAQALAEVWEAAEQKKYAATWVKQRTSEILRDDAASKAVQSTRAFFTEWTRLKKQQVKGVTMDSYTPKMDDFLKFLAGRRLADAAMTEITKRVVLDYLTQKRDKVSPSTANQYLKILRTLFAKALEEHWIIENPVAGIPTFSKAADEVSPTNVVKGTGVVKEDRRAFTQEELRALMSVADEEWQSMICFGVYTGQRLKDIAELRWGQVNFEHGEVVIKTSKGGKVVRPAIGSAFEAWLLKQQLPDDPNAPIHPKAFAAVERAGKTNYLGSQFGDLLAAAGLRTAIRRRREKGEEKLDRGGRRNRFALSFHALRHTHTSLLKMSGASQAVAMDNVGHASAAISAVYTHVDTASRKKYADLLPEI